MENRLPEPLIATDKPLRSDSDAFDLFAIGDWTIYSGPKTGQGVSEEQLAAYIAHAANAYPKLVEMLRKVDAANRLPAGLAHSVNDLLHELGEHS